MLILTVECVSQFGRVMNSNITTVAKSYTTPWTLRAYDTLPGNPFWIGIGFTIGLLLVFFVGRAIVEGANNSYPGDLRVAIIHILQTSYSASAYAYLLMTTRKTTHDLLPVARNAPQWQTVVDNAGKHSWYGRRKFPMPDAPVRLGSLTEICPAS